jgi:predicted Zn finger-like uncharacterized protein
MASDVSAPLTCPYCHTALPVVTADGLEARGDWRCVRCGQRWDAGRLATVAAYASWAVEHEKAIRDRPPAWDDWEADVTQAPAVTQRTAAV